MFCIICAIHCILVLLLIQGSASYWWNLKKSGERDYATRHAGCPVLIGSKWGESNRDSEQILEYYFNFVTGNTV